jgi:hypothetical protein
MQQRSSGRELPADAPESAYRRKTFEIKGLRNQENIFRFSARELIKGWVAQF